MTARFSSLLSILALSLISHVASADVGPGPRPRPPIRPPVVRDDAKVNVYIADGNSIRLRIPAKMLNVPAVPKPADAPRSEALPTIIIGTALAAAITLGGMRLVSRRRVSGRMLALVLGAGVAVVAASTAWANKAPPFIERPIKPEPAKPEPAKADAVATFPITIELTDGDVAEMTLSADQLAKLAPKANK